MKKENKLKRECDMCKVQFETWVQDYDYEEERDVKIRNNVNMFCPICNVLKEK
jgi:hypothetical protein